MAVALRTDVFLVGAFSSAGAAGETEVSLVGSGLVPALGVVVFAVVFLAVVVSITVVVLEDGED